MPRFIKAACLKRKSRGRACTEHKCLKESQGSTIRTALAIRDWARSIVAPMIVRVRGWIRRDRVRMLRRVQELRWAILAWMSGRQGLGPRTDEKPQPKRRR